MDIKTYTIPMAAKEEVEKAMTRLMKKADRYGKFIRVESSEPYAKERNIYDVDEFGIQHKVDTELVEVLDITIESETVIKDGYTVLARIEHLEGGNVVNTFTEDSKPEWSTILPRCQHCGGNHGQKVTFIVRHDDGTEKQVGKTCLKDYCGIDPQRIGIFNEIQDILLTDCFESYDFESKPVQIAHDTMKVLAFAIRVQKKQGYVKSEERGSNKDEVAKLVAEHQQPTDEEMEKAEAIKKTVCELDRDTAFRNLLDNVKTLLECGYCKESHFGYIAYAPVAYERYIEKVEKERKIASERESDAANSQYVGEIGGRVEIEVSEMKLLTSWENYYGTTYLYKIRDKTGNVFVWFSSRFIRDAENAKTMKGTVKDHSEKDGVKQTVLTRCKVA